jgi:hypothetical protein
LTDHTAFLATLAGIVGAPRHVIGPGGDFEPYVVDWRGRYHGKALAVVKPGSTQEVSPCREGLRGCRHRDRTRRAATPACAALRLRSASAT